MACQTIGSYGEESVSEALSELNQLMVTFELVYEGKVSSSLHRERVGNCETHRIVEHISPEGRCNGLIWQSLKDTIDHRLPIVRCVETDITLAGDLEHNGYRHRFSLSCEAQPYPNTIVVLIEEVH